MRQVELPCSIFPTPYFHLLVKHSHKKQADCSWRSSEISCRGMHIKQVNFFSLSHLNWSRTFWLYNINSFLAVGVPACVHSGFRSTEYLMIYGIHVHSAQKIKAAKYYVLFLFRWKSGFPPFSYFCLIITSGERDWERTCGKFCVDT